nr:unnamed protein product [Callosobruchus chinensis]
MTHFEKFILALEADMNNDYQDIDTIRINELQQRVERFNKTLDDFEEIQSEIECHSDVLDDHIQAEASEQTVCTLTTTNHSILSTALIYVLDKNGKRHPARTLLDCGSQSSFITTELANKLQIKKHETNLCISGITNNISYARHKCDLTILSCHNGFTFDLSCFVIDKITGYLPDFVIDKDRWNIPSNIRLADPTFHKPGKIDILLGANIFWHLLCIGQINIGLNKPLLQKTRLGWVIAGFYNNDEVTTKSSCHVSSIQQTLSKFWDVEEINAPHRPRSTEEQLCEKHYTDNLTTSPEGKYVVAIPFKGAVSTLGDSRDVAEKRFIQLEKKLQYNPVLRNLYIDFMHKYEELGHMTRISSVKEEPEYYMPDHGVLKESSATTKLRTVFNASCPSSSGVSLNMLQMNGPILQRDLVSILLSFRFHEVVLSSDIKIMYRMVLINPDQRKYQKIVWRDHPEQPLSSFQLNTVTYGTTSGSFLAIRSLFQVALECENKYPDIAEIIRNNMYVDDLLAGADNVKQAQRICNQIYSILKSRGFELRKWRSNCKESISQFEDSCNSQSLDFSLNKEHDSKLLGLSWNSETDTLHYKILATPLGQEKVTKRTILSKIATIFDPLGLLGPCIVLAKIFLQKLWLEKLTWDESLPQALHQSWEEYSFKLNVLSAIQIPRKVTCDNAIAFELHGFADASNDAYGHLH